MNTVQFYMNAIRHHKWKIGGMFFGDAVQAAFTLLIPYALKGIVDSLENYDSVSNGTGWDYMMEPFLWFIFVVLMVEFGARFSGLCHAFCAGVLRIRPRKDLINHLQNHSMNFFQNTHSGSLGSRVNEACVGLGFTVWNACFDLWPVFIKVTTGIILLFLNFYYIGWALTGWFMIYATISIFFGYKLFVQSSRLSDARSRITGKVVDMTTNIYAVKSFANETFEAEIMDEASDHERRVINRFQIFRETAGVFNSLMFSTLMIFIGYFTINGYIDQNLTLGDVSFIISMILVLVLNMQAMMWSVNHFLENVGQTREGVRTIYGKRTVNNTEDAEPLVLKSPIISLNDVVFYYPEKPDISVFNDFNLTVPAGQKIGVVGSSGAGKSTFLNLLLRFYDIDGGSIKIDGQDISKVTQESLRKNIAVIPQDTSLFHRTLMENIRYGRLEASDEEVIEAAKQAHIHDFILTLPEGYETLVGERGVKLSGGQRQRIAIARAILKNAPILILDEATSALDSESEKFIQDSLKTLMEGKTVIAIAHRLSTIAHLDRIIVMDQGKIVEDGTHLELLKLDRHYAMLWGMQSGGFLKG